MMHSQLNPFETSLGPYFNAIKKKKKVCVKAINLTLSLVAQGQKLILKIRIVLKEKKTIKGTPECEFLSCLV